MSAIELVAKMSRPVWGYIIYIYPKPDVSIFALFQVVKLIFARIFALGQKWGKNFCPWAKMHGKHSAKVGILFRILGGATFYDLLCIFWLVRFFLPTTGFFFVFLHNLKCNLFHIFKFLFYPLCILGPLWLYVRCILRVRTVNHTGRRWKIRGVKKCCKFFSIFQNSSKFRFFQLKNGRNCDFFNYKTGRNFDFFG